MGSICLATMIVIQLTSQTSGLGPYLNRSLNKLQIFLDVMLMALADFMVAFNGGGFVSPDQQVRFDVGWAYVFFLAVSSVVPVVAMVVVTMSTVQNNLMRVSFKKSREQQKRDKRLNRAARKQSLRMAQLTNLNLQRVGSHADGSSGTSSFTLSPSSGSQVVMQNADDKLAVQAD